MRRILRFFVLLIEAETGIAHDRYAKCDNQDPLEPLDILMSLIVEHNEFNPFPFLLQSILLAHLMEQIVRVEHLLNEAPRDAIQGESLHPTDGKLEHVHPYAGTLAFRAKVAQRPIGRVQHAVHDQPEDIHSVLFDQFEQLATVDLLW